LRRSLPASNANLRKFDAQEEMPPKLLHRWRCDAGYAWRNIKRIVVAFEAGRDGFRLALVAGAMLRLTSSIRPASRRRANTGARRPIVSIRNFYFRMLQQIRLRCITDRSGHDPQSG
jgi:hypothetical protein